jgi:hypothetical protein
MTDERRAYDTARIVALLEGGHAFEFEVQDWDVDEKPLGSEEAQTMADSLVKQDGVVLFGMLNGHHGHTRIDPARVVAVLVQPTGIR